MRIAEHRSAALFEFTNPGARRSLFLCSLLGVLEALRTRTIDDGQAFGILLSGGPLEMLEKRDVKARNLVLEAFTLGTHRRVFGVRRWKAYLSRLIKVCREELAATNVKDGQTISCMVRRRRIPDGNLRKGVFKIVLKPRKRWKAR